MKGPRAERLQKGFFVHVASGEHHRHGTRKGHGSRQQGRHPHGPRPLHHQMVGAVGGTWNVSGNQVSATASAMGQNISIVAEIKGNNLWYQGRALKRIH